MTTDQLVDALLGVLIHAAEDEDEVLYLDTPIDEPENWIGDRFPDVPVGTAVQVLAARCAGRKPSRVLELLANATRREDIPR